MISIESRRHQLVLKNEVAMVREQMMIHRHHHHLDHLDHRNLNLNFELQMI
jgi:hypothetical protein